MRRYVSVILVLALLASTMPFRAMAADSGIYERNVILLANNYEAAFRDWAAALFEEYMNNLFLENRSSLDHTQKEELLSIVGGYNGPNGEYSIATKLKQHDKCAYHLYYELGALKQEFDYSDEARKEHNGETLNSVKYSINSVNADKEEMDTLYMYFVMNTLKEKEYAKLTYSKNLYDKGSAGYINKKTGTFNYFDADYVFDISTGKFVQSELLRLEDASTSRQARADLVDAFIKTLEYALDGWETYKIIVTELESGEIKKFDWAGIKSDSDGKDINALIQGIWDKFAYSLLKQVIKAVLDSVNEIEQNANKNAQAGYDNLIKAQAQDDMAKILVGLKEDMLDIVDNELSIYIDETNIGSIPNGYALLEAFKKVKSIISSDEWIDSVLSDGELGALVKNQYSFDAKKVLSKEQIALYNITITLDHAMDLIIDVINELIKAEIDSIEVLTKSLKEKKLSVDITSLLNILPETLKAIGEEAKKRMKDAEDEAVKLTKKYVDEKILTSYEDVGGYMMFELSRKMQKHFGWDDTSLLQKYTSLGGILIEPAPDNVIAPDKFEDACLNLLIKQVIIGVSGCLANSTFKKTQDDKAENVASDDRSDKLFQAILTVISKVIKLGVDICWDVLVLQDDKMDAKDKEMLQNAYSAFSKSLVGDTIESFGKEGIRNTITSLVTSIVQGINFILEIQTYYDRVRGTDKEPWHIEDNGWKKDIWDDPTFKNEFLKRLGKELRGFLTDAKLFDAALSILTDGVGTVEVNENRTTNSLIDSLFSGKGLADTITQSVMYDLSKIMELVGKHIEKLWNSADKAAVALWKAYYSWHNSMGDEDVLSFEAAQCYLAWKNSSDIEKKVFDGLNRIGKEDVDIDTIYKLSQLILMQNDFDVVGMGSYLSISNKIRHNYAVNGLVKRPNYFAQKLLQAGTLIVSKDEDSQRKRGAEDKYKEVVQFGRDYKTTWDPKWDVLFQ